MALTATLVELNTDGIAWLSNKSVYRIPPGHLKRIADWAPGMEVVVEHSDNAAWQYILKSPTNAGQWVHATPSGGKIFP